MLKHRFSQSLVAVFVILSVLCQGTLVLAGTTGTLSGTVTDSATSKPIAGAKVTAVSPSQTAATTTDPGGHYNFLNLAPDTYTVSIDAEGYQPTSVPGVTIQADNTRVLALTTQAELKTIGRVTSRAASSLVRPGVTSDVYSITPAVQQKVAAAGGGGNLDSAWSALATVPGVAVAPGQQGYIGAGATLSIRGGDYDQIGYEFDGVPLNRAFDNYPSSGTSSLGQQELQVYTGAPPAGATSEGISGFINQVIKTGTSPGFEDLTAGIGGAAFYHKLSFEAGGLTADRRLSYYVGVGGYDQTYRYVDNFNGAGVSQLYGLPAFGSCAGPQSIVPSCYTAGQNNGGFPLLATNDLSFNLIDSRDSVVNLHYYFPHQDGSRDDVQLLYDNSYLRSNYYSSPLDFGYNLLQTIGITPTYVDGYQLDLPVNGLVNTFTPSQTSIYYAPNTPAHSFDGPIQPNEEDGITNNQAIEKIQFTKSLGSSAYARLYGYSYYSNWFISGPNSTVVPTFADEPGDYELSSHTRGVDFQLADQLNTQNLLTLEGSWTTATTLRDYNAENSDGFTVSTPTVANSQTAIGVLVNSKHPNNGVCYSAVGAAVPCFSDPTDYNYSGPTAAQFATLGEAVLGTVPAITAASCGGSPCQYLVVGNGQYSAGYNTVAPTFWGLSLTDEFRPLPQLTINAGGRLDVYQYKGANTDTGPAREFWYAAFNSEMCENTANKSLQEKVFQLGLPSVASPCSLANTATASYVSPAFSNPATPSIVTYPVFQPRIGATFAVNPTTVLRASYGRYSEPPNSAFEEYDFLQTDAPEQLYGNYNFQDYGYTSPLHGIPPATSNNYDFSIEHEFPGQTSIKVSPFLRTTANQAADFYLDRATNFVSGLNVGSQTSRGVEFELDKGDFARQGLSAKLSFTYTNSYIKYYVLSNGNSVLTPVVQQVQQYNQYTAGCATITKANATACGLPAGSANPNSAPCFTPGSATAPGVGTACSTAGAVANPYYNAPLQTVSDFLPSANIIPYDFPPSGFGFDANQIGYPYFGSLVLNEHIDKLSITPVIQVFAGQRYGDPISTAGIQPGTCGALAGATTTTGDPRYPYGAAGGLPFDATTCGDLSGIPDVNTGKYDAVGQFVEPALLLLHTQLSYDVSKNFQIVANLTNIYSGCFGGSKEPWNVKGACYYQYPNDGLAPAVGNTYNPGKAIQPNGLYAYSPYWIPINGGGELPFAAYVTANFKL
jgi:hypothetical protein